MWRREQRREWLITIVGTQGVSARLTARARHGRATARLVLHVHVDLALLAWGGIFLGMLKSLRRDIFAPAPSNI